jgi:hypothetical protein
MLGVLLLALLLGFFTLAVRSWERRRSYADTPLSNNARFTG